MDENEHEQPFSVCGKHASDLVATPLARVRQRVPDGVREAFALE